MQMFTAGEMLLVPPGVSRTLLQTLRNSRWAVDI